MDVRRGAAPGAIVMIGLTVPVALPTLGFGVVLTLPICVLWAALAALRNGAGPALHAV